jgi:hypothetical protein
LYANSSMPSLSLSCHFRERIAPGDDLRPPETYVPLATLTHPFRGSDCTCSLRIRQSSEPRTNGK